MRWRFVALCALLLIAAASTWSFEAVGGFSAGTILQDGSKGTFAFSAGMEAPAVTREGSYQIVASTTYLYSDRGFDTADEVQAIVTMIVGRKFIGPGFLGFGSGLWYFTNTKGEDVSPAAYRLEAGYSKFGFEFVLGGDIVLVPHGPDMYFPNLKVRILGL